MATWSSWGLALLAIVFIRQLWFWYNSFDLRNRVYLISGGGSGLGRALCHRLGRLDNAAIAVCDVNEQAAQAVVQELVAQGCRRARSWRLDVTDPRAVDRVVGDIALQLGQPVSVLINNAGIVVGGSLSEQSEASISRTFEVNCTSHAWTWRACLPGMMASRTGALLVTIASASGLLGVNRLASYSASKAAACMLHESIRAEVKARGLDVHTLLVNPYYFASGMFQGVKSRLHFPGLLPILTLDDLADRIVLAMGRGEQYLAVPWLVYTVPLLRGLLPVPLFDTVARLLGVHEGMSTFTGRQQPGVHVHSVGSLATKEEVSRDKAAGQPLVSAVTTPVVKLPAGQATGEDRRIPTTVSHLD